MQICEGIENLLVTVMLKKDYENTPFLYSLFGNWPKIFQFGIIIQNDNLWNLKLLKLNQLQ
jgi:hypothetical protein